MAQVETANTGEGDAEMNDVKAWMTQNNIRLSSDTYNKLKDNGFETLDDLRQCTTSEMKEYADTMNIKMADKSKLTRAIEKLSGKKNLINPQEINAMKSINIKIDKFKNNLNQLTNTEQAINDQKIKIETEIKTTFNTLRSQAIQTLNQREKLLLDQLNDITNKKTKLIQNKLNDFNVSLKSVNKIKQDTNILMDTAVDHDELHDRTLKVIENEKQVTKIIDDNNDKHSKTVINPKLNFTLNTQNAIKFMEPLGIISQINVPVLDKVEYDNDNANGIVKVHWSLNDDHKDNVNKISIEYGMINDDNKEDDIDEKELKMTEFNIENKTRGIENIKVDVVGLYLFKARCNNNVVMSPYSNIKTVNVGKIGHPLQSSTILTMDEKIKLLQIMNEQLNSNNTKKLKFSLLYRYSRDEKTIKGFHKVCDNKGATITIVQSKTYNHVFGGYTAIPWTSESGYHEDPTVFLFVLRSAFGGNFKAFKVNENGKNAVYHCNSGGSYGPLFGNNGAIAIVNGDNKCFSHINNKFEGIKGNALCGGDTYNEQEQNHYFSIEDYEVFQVKIE